MQIKWFSRCLWEGADVNGLISDLIQRASISELTNSQLSNLTPITG